MNLQRPDECARKTIIRSDQQWEREIDPEIITGEAWEAIAKRGFDPARIFAAYVNTLRWNCVAATDPPVVPVAVPGRQPPFRFRHRQEGVSPPSIGPRGRQRRNPKVGKAAFRDCAAGFSQGTIASVH